VCDFPREYEALPCSLYKDTLCVPASEPLPGEFVLEVVSEKRDTRIFPYSVCSTLGKWEELNQPPKAGNSTYVGRDKTCYDYNACDLEETFVKNESTLTSDFVCETLTDCSELARNRSLPSFAVVQPSRNTDRICMICDEYDPEKPSKYESAENWNRTLANEEYMLTCRQTESLSTAGIIAIGGAGFIAILAFSGLMIVHRRKKRALKQRDEAERELNTAKDDLELADSMVKNPLTYRGESTDNKQLVASVALKDAEIMNLREEVRRLKMMMQRSDHASSFGRIEMSSKGRKKQFGQSQA
jgi:hypothetical protein